ncbi:MAG TPA: hypothetical protein PKZ88_08285 [Methanothermobacter sp.]|nr:hypothetical protein [Methanothermobacter sp.]
MMGRRMITVKDSKELERVVNELVVLNEYKVESFDQKMAKLHKPKFGNPWVHLLIFVLTVWFTLGLLNVIYLIYSYVTRDKVLVRVEGEDPPLTL